MEQPTPSTRKNNLSRDILIALIVIAASALSLVLLPLFFVSVLFCCALFCGGRKRFALLLLAASFAVQVFFAQSFFLALLFLAAACIMIAPNAIFRGRFANRAHFDGVLASCAGVALMIAAVYGILYLGLGGEPIHILCESSHASFAADTSEFGTEMLRTMWQTQQVFYMAQGADQMAFADAIEIVNESLTLSHAELVAQTQGFIEFMTRTTLPSICVIFTALGGLLLYVLPTHWAANRARGMGRFLSLNQEARKLPAFADWKLPRDIGNVLFIAVILLLIASFMGFAALDGAMSLIYTLFTTVFYVEGICFAAFMVRRWKWNRFGRFAFSVLAAVLVSPVSMIGTIDYIIRLREFMDFSKTLKEAAQSGNTEKIKHIFPGVTIHSVFEVKAEEKDAAKDENDNTQETQVNPGAEDAHDDKED